MQTFVSTILSNSQNLAATAAAGSQDTAAVFGGHPGAEAVHLAALALFRLVSTKHGTTLLVLQKSCICDAHRVKRRKIPQNSYSSILTGSLHVKRKFLFFHSCCPCLTSSPGKHSRKCLFFLTRECALGIMKPFTAMYESGYAPERSMLPP